MHNIEQPELASEGCRKTTVWVPKGENYGSSSSGTLFVGFDTEFQQSNLENRVLSYQYFAIDAPERHFQGIYLPNGRRCTLPRFLSWVVMEGLKQQKLSKWPESICLIGHFTLADLTLFSDFNYRKSSFDAIRRTFISLRPFTCRLYDENRHAHRALVTLRDSMLLAPTNKKSLKALGDLVGVGKIELEQDEIENMAALLRENPSLFKTYALRDPEICVRYALRIAQMNGELTGEFEVPPTLSSVGVNYLLKLWKDRGISKHAVLGTEALQEETWSQERKAKFRRKRTVPILNRYIHDSFVSECYHGGRNEQYFFGAGEKGVWTDWDLAGAYTTALALIGLPDWNSIRSSRDIEEYQPNVLGFAQVQFRFPNQTRFPCLPVRVASGLVFPLTGISCCGAPEIYLAQRLGADLQISNGFIVPSSFEKRPFEEFIIECTRWRKAYPKGSLEELLWKEIGNSTYGKLAQGLMHKRCFDSRTGSHRDLPPSQITNPYFAAYTTSFVRAVLGEILARIPLHATVCNATTDGFLTCATKEEVMTATEGPLCRLFSLARHRLCNDVTVLEPKHRISQPLGWRTRGQATLTAIPGEDIVLAKAGLKPPMVEKELQNEWIVSLFAERTPDRQQTFTTLRNLPEIWKRGGDLIPKELTRRISMDYDWKRCPVCPQKRPVRSIDHLYFDTAPWESPEEFSICRDAWEQFQSNGSTVLKTEADLTTFLEYKLIHQKISLLQKPRKAPALTLAKRLILRAIVRSQWGLSKTTMSYSDLAHWLSDGGFRTSKSDIENAARPASKLIEHAVPRTAETERLTSFVRQKFPAFDESKLFETP